MTPTRLKLFFPFLAWPRPTRSSARDDLLAGIAVALLAIPQSLAYAQLAGVPAQYGLYAALIPSMVGVLFGSCYLLSTGPVALTSMLTAASVAQAAAPGSDSYIAIVMLLALLSGLFQVALGLARAGALLNLLSHPVLTGFVNAAALVIVLTQLPALAGIAVPQDGSVVQSTWHLASNAQAAHGATMAFATLAVVLLIGFNRFAPKLPGVLGTMVILTLLSQATQFGSHGGAIIGAIALGMPGLSVPAISWQSLLTQLPAALVIALVSFMEVMSSCKTIAAKTRTRWDENQELIGQGLAKVVAAFCHSMPVSGSFSRSALNLATHARSGWSSLFAAGCVGLTLACLTPLLYHLPKAALAAVIVMAVTKLIDVPAMRNAWRAQRDDGAAALLTFVATLAFAPDIQHGILAGIVFSLGAFIYRRMLPQVAVQALGRDGVLRTIDGREHRSGPEAVAVLRFDAALFFANASFFADAVLKLERECAGLRVIVVQANGINLLDATGVEMLRALIRQLRERGIRLVFSNAKQQFQEVAERSGLSEQIGRENFFAGDDAAFKAVLERLRATPPAGTAQPPG